MDTQILANEAKKLTMKPKGILAIDESVGTCGGRFEKLGVENTEENRRKYRELLVTCHGIEEYVSGFILFDETIRQSTIDGLSFVNVLKNKSISVGIKVDMGTKDLPGRIGEKFTEGLDGLNERLLEYHNMGASFAKWRAVISIDIAKNLPSPECLEINSQSLSEYARISQENNIVPIVEPEVIMDGIHNIEDSYNVTSKTLQTLFKILKEKNIFTPGLILKTSMVISGKDCPVQATKEQIAEMTIKCLKENVPSDIGGIVFLSGGQTEAQACENLRTMHQIYPELPWPLSFSYGRAIQYPALKAWAANMDDVAGAQALLLENARNNANANLGQ